MLGKSLGTNRYSQCSICQDFLLIKIMVDTGKKFEKYKSQNPKVHFSMFSIRNYFLVSQKIWRFCHIIVAFSISYQNIWTLMIERRGLMMQKIVLKKTGIFFHKKYFWIFLSNQQMCPATDRSWCSNKVNINKVYQGLQLD